jgi:anti-sigma factor RsiW
MAQCRHIIELLSEYHEGALTAKAHQEVTEHLARCSKCALADRDLRRTVTLLGHIPMPEPELDLWTEFAPKMAEAEAQQRLGLIGRVRGYWRHAMAMVAEGTVLYTHALAQRSLMNMERYLIRDPFRMTD